MDFLKVPCRIGPFSREKPKCYRRGKLLVLVLQSFRQSSAARIDEEDFRRLLKEWLRHSVGHESGAPALLHLPLSEIHTSLDAHRLLLASGDEAASGPVLLQSARVRFRMSSHRSPAQAGLSASTESLQSPTIPRIELDSPFLFAVADSAGTILLLGRFMHPPSLAVAVRE